MYPNKKCLTFKNWIASTHNNCVKKKKKGSIGGSIERPMRQYVKQRLLWFYFGSNSFHVLLIFGDVITHTLVGFLWTVKTVLVKVFSNFLIAYSAECFHVLILLNVIGWQLFKIPFGSFISYCFIIVLLLKLLNNLLNNSIDYS